MLVGPVKRDYKILELKISLGVYNHLLLIARTLSTGASKCFFSYTCL